MMFFCVFFGWVGGGGGGGERGRLTTMCHTNNHSEDLDLSAHPRSLKVFVRRSVSN